MDLPVEYKFKSFFQCPESLLTVFIKQTCEANVVPTKDVEIWGCLWETADHICTNPKCRYVLNGYGTYGYTKYTDVSKLKKEYERLKNIYEPDSPKII